MIPERMEQLLKDGIMNLTHINADIQISQNLNKVYVITYAHGFVLIDFNLVI